jgi:hypothetical protein
MFFLCTLCAAILLALPISHVYAYDLRLVCDATISTPDGRQFSMKRRFDITWDSSSLDVYENWGRGWEPAENFRYVLADNDRLLIRNSGGHVSSIERSSGTYFGRITSNAPNTKAFYLGTTTRGTCSPHPF